jgi:predicted transcriptional regulator
VLNSCTNVKYAEISYPIASQIKAFSGVYLMVSKIRVRSESHRLVRKRSDIDIMANILSVTKKGAKKTRIMYKCNLSHSQLQVYLQILSEMGFLSSHSKKEGAKPSYFKTDSKGFEFLDAYRVLKGLMT